MAQSGRTGIRCVVPTVPYAGEGIRQARFGKNYLIFYREIAGGIEVQHVIHGRRNLPALFGDDD